MAKKAIRPIRIEGNVAYVPLTRGHEAVIDAADVSIIGGFSWWAVEKGNTTYAVRQSGPRTHRVTTYMHMAILPVAEGHLVDHRDGNGLNNRRSNLRAATVPQNQHNRPIGRKNTSGFKGVCWSKRDGRWQANIRINGKKRSLGLHSTAEEAHAAYAKASAELHGVFGRPQ